MFFSFSGIKTASSEVLPAALSFLNRNLMSFCLLSSGTIGSPSMTTKVSRPSSSFTSYCALRSGRVARGLKSAGEGQKKATPRPRDFEILTGEVDLLLFFLVKILLRESIETGRHGCGGRHSSSGRRVYWRKDCGSRFESDFLSSPFGLVFRARRANPNHKRLCAI